MILLSSDSLLHLFQKPEDPENTKRAFPTELRATAEVAGGAI
jgi:hypothetical protein